MRPAREYWSNIPLLALTAANLVPLFGAFFLGWEAFDIVLLYWAENLAVGFYNILKIAFVQVSRPIEHLGKLFLIPFFAVHYGGFTAGHGFFILMLFKKGEEPFPAGDAWPCFFVFLQMLLNVIKQAYSVMSTPMRYALAGLFLSHGISFVYNYLLKGEFKRTNPQKLMSSPYARIVVMHLAIIIGAFISMALGSPVAVLAVLVVLKTALDIKLHLKEHDKIKPQPVESAQPA